MPVPTEADRLLAYYHFDHDILECVSAVAEAQRATTWQALKAKLPKVQRFTPQHGKPINVIDIIPSDGYDSTLVYHMPTGCDLDDNMLFGVATLAAAEPAARLIAVGSPGAPGWSSGKVRLKDLGRVWSGDMEPTVDALLQYLAQQNVQGAVHIGGSAGADRAVAAAVGAERYGQHVSHLVLFEPVSVINRHLVVMAQRFFASGKSLESYVQAARSGPYIEAREPGNNLRSAIAYAIGLFRPTNVAIAHALAQDGFESRVRAALTAQEDMLVDVIWGSESELATHAHVLGVTQRLTEQFGHDRVRTTVMDGHTHAMPADIFLQVALILQSLKH